MGRWRGRRRSAYYSRNNSYSRSANAENAESNGRYPRTRAASALGVSVKAFDAGCQEAGYSSTEWHHVGKYAAMVDYYDTNQLADDPDFWKGCAGAYASKKKKAELMAKHAERMDEQKEERIGAFRAKLIRQRDCSRPVRTHDGSARWHRYCMAQPHAAFRGVGMVPPGDFAGLALALHVNAELREHADYRMLVTNVSHREIFCYRTERAAWLENEALKIVTVVPEIHAGSDCPDFRLLDSVRLIAIGIRKFFTRRMVDARRIAAEHGFNAVIPANPTAHKYGNGWLPAIVEF